MIAGALARTARAPARGAGAVRARPRRARRAADQRKPGDEAIVLRTARSRASSAGTCAESTVRPQAELALLDAGESLLLRITPEPEADGSRARGVVVAHNPCLSGGTLEIFLEPVAAGAAAGRGRRRPRSPGRSPSSARARATRSSPTRGAAPRATRRWSSPRTARARRTRSPRRCRAGVPYVGARREPQARRGGAWRRSTCPTTLRERVHAPPGSTSAPARRRRSRCRSWPRSSPSARRTLPRSSTRHTAAMGTEAVAALVLAAGGSRRLGRPKQLLPLGGGDAARRRARHARAPAPSTS